MSDDWSRFYVEHSGGKTGSTSKNVMLYLIEFMDIKNKKYIKQSDVFNKLKSMATHYYLPSDIERYVIRNMTKFTGMNVKYCECSFCQELDVIFTREDKGVSILDSVCSDNCRRFYRMKSKCSKSFFKGIPKTHKGSDMTIMLYALSKRSKIIKKLMRNI